MPGYMEKNRTIYVNHIYGINDKPVKCWSVYAMLFGRMSILDGIQRNKFVVNHTDFQPVDYMIKKISFFTFDWRYTNFEVIVDDLNMIRSICL